MFEHWTLFKSTYVRTYIGRCDPISLSLSKAIMWTIPRILAVHIVRAVQICKSLDPSSTIRNDHGISLDPSTITCFHMTQAVFRPRLILPAELEMIMVNRLIKKTSALGKAE